MNNLSKIRARFLGYNVDPDVLNAYRSAIPSTIDLKISTKGDYYVAEIKTIENEKLPVEEMLITEAKSQDELVNMVNDLIFTYKNIPEVYRPFYKQILKPSNSIKKTESLKLTKVA